MSLKVLELFGGIGACSAALDKLGIDYQLVDYVEIDKFAVKSFNLIHNTNFDPQDITTWDKDISVDFIMHGSPCTDFSVAGKQLGGDNGSGTRSSLMWETIRIVEKLKPKYVVWENVKNLLSKKHKHNFDAYLEKMESLGYTNYYQVLDAQDYNVPQHRERIFTISILGDTSFTFPQHIALEKYMGGVLEESVDEKYYLSDKMVKYISAIGTANYKNKDSRINLDIARPLTTEPDKRAGTTNYICKELPSNFNLAQYNNDCNKTPLRIRRLTPQESWRLMGFPDEYYKRAATGNSDKQLYKQAGNSIVVNCLEAIFKELFRGFYED